jgi:two-component system sensor histidine kinase RegB
MPSLLTPTPILPPQGDLELGLAWFLRLRWGAVGVQLALLAIARFALQVRLPLEWMLALTTLTAMTNVLVSRFERARAYSWTLPGLLAGDVLLLTLVLALSGGPTNPFSVFFLVHVALAAVLLDARASWSLVALTTLAFGSLFLLPAANVHHDHAAMQNHLLGMWVAYILASAFVAYFVGEVSKAVRARDRRLATIASLVAQNERLATLSAFSANAAHELGTPLATIGLAANETLRSLQRQNAAGELVGDIELICHEVRRCKEILSSLAARAGDVEGEMPVSTTPAAVIDELRKLASPMHWRELDVSFDKTTTANAPLVAPPKTLAQMLLNLVQNAFDAQAGQPNVSVELRVERRATSQNALGSAFFFHILDRGPGLAELVRERLGAPFVSTKTDGGGLGLGIFLARAYAERTGGELTFEPREPCGLDVTLRVSNNALRTEV